MQFVFCLHACSLSVSQFGARPWYLESCASTLASTYSSGDNNEGKIVSRIVLGILLTYHLFCFEVL